jgi:hypothetical protein
MRYHLPLAIAIAAAAVTAGCGLKKSHDDPDGPFVFASDPPTAYVQIDRFGMPAVATAVITNKDAYNVSDPATDASGLFLAQIQANLTAIHAALDDDLTGLGLKPASVGTALAQASWQNGTLGGTAGSLVVPDTMKIDTTQPAGFPNGRKLTDPVIDVTLAVLLLDFSQTTTSGSPQGPGLLAGLPLNPPANDKAFLSDFPYLATPF